MVDINLLPWRAMIRAENEKKRNFFLLFLGLLILIWIVVHIGLNFAMQTYDIAIDHAKNQLDELTSQTQNNQTNSASSIVDQIHSSQLELIDFFKAVEEAAPGMMAWSSIESRKNHIVMTGNVDSFLALAQFVDDYNNKNRALAMNIVNVKNDFGMTAVQCRLQLIRSSFPFLSQINNDDNI
ncbi:MAG: hypothetical protein K0S27_431 [Gammaproteobacteria bacterium]|jgi:hypothetical protein|nr:hypothetical protein [Gammaproteobacteria bacterium]